MRGSGKWQMDTSKAEPEILNLEPYRSGKQHKEPPRPNKKNTKRDKVFTVVEADSSHGVLAGLLGTMQDREASQ